MNEKGGVARRSLFRVEDSCLAWVAAGSREPRLLLGLKPRRESLGLGDALDFECDGIDSCLDPLEPPIDRAQLARRHRPRLQPLRYQSHNGKAEHQRDDARNHPRKHLMNDQVWIWLHSVPGKWVAPTLR